MVVVVIFIMMIKCKFEKKMMQTLEKKETPFNACTFFSRQRGTAVHGQTDDDFTRTENKENGGRGCENEGM